MQEREYGPLSEGKPTRRDGSASRLSATGIDPQRSFSPTFRCYAAIPFDEPEKAGCDRHRLAVAWPWTSICAAPGGHRGHAAIARLDGRTSFLGSRHGRLSLCDGAPRPESLFETRQRSVLKRDQGLACTLTE